jgi:hypothetical protein
MRTTNEAVQPSIVVRGQLTADHQLHHLVTDLVPKIAFKLLMSLACEGIAARTNVERIVPPLHPLASSLSGMTTPEAMAYLIGITSSGNFGRTVEIQLPAPSVETSSEDQALKTVPTSPNNGIAFHFTPPAPALSDEIVEVSDEDLDMMFAPSLDTLA